MNKNFTQKSTFFFAFCLLWLLQLVTVQGLFAQSAPIKVDLTGQPNGIYNSPLLDRNGSGCGTQDKNENCIQFEITLDRNAGGLDFSIIDGPVPSGSMSYQINCGTPVPVGQPICVSGTGPHILTICMPGGARNAFRVTSIAAFTPQADVSVSVGCTANLSAPIAFNEASITWRDITGGGAYNRYLSATAGRSTVIVTPDDNAPAYVDYEVCGQSVASPCSTLPYCDVVRVYFHKKPTVSIGPSPAIICPGSSGVPLTGTVTGGDGNFQYIWTNSAGNVVSTAATYLAPTVGTYELEVRNTNYPSCQKFSASVTVVTNLTANAGPDQLVCSTSPVSLAGTVTAATGGIWSGGNGSFSPSNTALNAVYVPTSAELQAGSVKLTLISTGNGSCDPVSDEVLITFYNMEVSISGPSIICAGTTANLITASVTGAQGALSYAWNTGETSASISNKPAGTYTVTVTDEKGCSISKSFTVTEAAGPSDLAVTLRSTTCGASNGELSITGTTGGTAPYTYSLDGAAFQTATTYTGLLQGTHTLAVKDANGCVYTKTVTLQDIPGPTDFTASTKSSTCGNSNGSITVTGVTSGTSSYTYSVDGGNFQTSATLSGLAAGTHAVTVKDANGCVFTKQVTVENIAGPTAMKLEIFATNCEGKSGYFRILEVTGGTGPYMYTDGRTPYQGFNTFGDWEAGTYTVTVKDANGCTYSQPVTIPGAPGPKGFTETVKPSVCGAPNGELTIDAISGGTAPFTYSIDGGGFQSSSTFASLLPGPHQVIVKDARECTFTRTVQVTDVAAPTDFAATFKPSTCGASNGEIDVNTVTDGTAPYTYSINGGAYQASTSFTALAAGTHTISIKDANGCLYSKTVTLQDRPGPTNFTATTTSSTCGNPNGVINITGTTSGTSPFTYSINGGAYQTSATFSGLAAGNHTITVRDANGCTFAKAITLENVAGPTAMQLEIFPTNCEGESGYFRIVGVTGGTAPYMYTDGRTPYQEFNTFGDWKAGTYTVTVRDANGCTYSQSVTIPGEPGPSGFTETVKPSICGARNGEITVGSISGGTAPFTYSIDGGGYQSSATFASVLAGPHQVVVRDARGCTFTKSVQVSDIAGPTGFTAQIQTTSCGRNNGSIEVSGIISGTAPYTYSKDGTNFQASSSFSSLTAGTYTITVKDANGCTFSKAVEVRDIAGPTNLALTAVSSTCGASNGSISVGTVTGGTAPFTYSKDGTNFQASTSFTGLSAGTHTITVRDDNGCVYTKSIVVSDIAGPSDLAATAVSSTCGNPNGTLTVTGVTGGTASYTYSKDGVNFQASASFTGLAAGTHTITVRDANGCTFAKAFTVNNIAGPTAVTATSQPASCNDNDGRLTVGTVTGGTAPYTYSINGTTFQEGLTFTALASGTYTVTAKDANGCLTTVSVSVSKNVPTAFASSTTSSTCGSSNGSITIGAITGGTAPYTYSKDGATFQASATFSGLLAGTHTITVKDVKGCTFARQVTLSDVAGPTGLVASMQSSSCGANNGSISIGSVTGGTAPYTYSRDGVNYQASTSFTNLLAGTYTITAKDANGCVATETVVVRDVAGPSNVVLTSTSSTCGSSNGQISVGTVTGGTAPYTYSKDGTTFQASSSFSSLTAGTYTITVRDANGCTFSKAFEVKDIAGPRDLTLIATSSTCGSSNGSVSVDGVTGGTTPYAYSINGGSFQASASFAALAAGTHTITVRDANGCTFAKTVTVSDVAGPSNLAASTVSSTCGASNGALTITNVTGGTSSYTYSKDGVTFQTSATFTNLLAGTYTITVKDANGCTFARAFAVTNITGPTAVAATSSPASCNDNDGSITVGNVSGGTAPYTYSINGTTFQAGTTFTALASGTYTVTAKDANGCLTTASVTIQTNVPTAFVSSTNSSTCGSSNGSITIGAITGGTAPYTYSKGGAIFQASATFSGLAAGTHTITVKDANGCTFSRQVTLSDVAGPTGLIASTQTSSCGNPNGSLTVTRVTGGTSPYTYSKDGVNFQNSTSFPNLLAGTYTITAKDANGCTTTETVAIRDIEAPSNVVLNPVSSTCGNSNGSITVGTVTGGTAPYTYSLNGGSFQTSTTFASLRAAQYTIMVKDANGCTFSKTLEVEDMAGPADLTLATTASTCGNSNGSISINGVTNGTAPYTYSLDGAAFQNGTTFTRILAGEHTITVRDANGCTFSKKVTVSDVAGPSNLVATAVSSTCGASNGTLTITGVTGGTAPYMYSANGVNFQASATFTALAAGNHTITVKDANGCTFAKVFAVENIAGPTATTATTSPASCADNDGSLTVTGVSGGTAPYTYSINGTTFQSGTTFTALASGTYTVTAKDANGCLTTVSVAVSKNVPTAFASSTVASTCGRSDGGLTIGQITGGTAPYTYSRDGVTFQASASFANLAAGTYTITVKDANGCTFSRGVAVSNISGPVFAATASTTTCGANNGSISVGTVTGGVAPYTYSKDGVTFQASTTFSDLLAGTYTIVVKDANGCLSSETVVVNDIAGPDNVVLTSTSSTCGSSNGQITIGEVTGGTAPFTYSLNGGSFQSSASFMALRAAEYTITVKDANGCTFSKEVEVKDIAGPSNLTLASVSTTCGASNGSASVDGVTGGTAPYTFSLNGAAFQASTSFAGLAAGTHTITVRDANGCTFVKSVVVNDIAGPSNLAASAVSSTCGSSNGTLTITATNGGTAPYTYSKDGVTFQASATFTGLMAGTHTITVKDANGCTYAKAFVVNNIAGPTAVAANTAPASCNDNDGSIMINGVTGGTAPYTYSINGTTFQAEATFTALASGTYTVTAKDANSCLVTASVTIQTNVPTAFASSTNSSTCGSSNGSITIRTITGGTAPYTYSKDGVTFQTSATLTGLAAGTHTITVKDAKGCTYARQVILGDVAGPTGLIASLQSSTCGANNGAFTITTVSGGTAPYTYSKDGTFFQASANFTNLLAGTYTITVKDANGCTTTETVVLRDIAGPSNLALNSVSSTCGSSNGQIVVANVTGGTAPYTYSINGTTFQASATFTALASNTYTITVKDANGCIFSKAVEVDNIAGPSNLTLATTSSTCGSSNGAVTVNGVIGGTAPYTYSINGSAFQSSTTFASVLAGEHTVTVKDANGCTFAGKVTVGNIAGPSNFLATTRSSTCAARNGELTISEVTNGVAPYTYSRDGVNFQASATFTGLLAGSYTIHVKDANGCTFSKAVSVSDITGPNAIAASSTPASCLENDGSITIAGVTGGTAPYTYSVNGGAFSTNTVFTRLASGTYRVTARDANGCETVSSVIIQKNVPTAFASSTVASTCGNPNGSITIGTITGGTAPYTYSRDGATFQASSTFSALAAGNYTITVKDAKGCTFARPVTLSNANGPSDLVTSMKASTCGDSNGELTISGVTGGTAPYTYSKDGTTFQSSATFTGLIAGAYTFTVKDANGCVYSEEASLSDVSGPSFLATSRASTCGDSNGQIAVTGVTGGVAPYTYSKDGTNFQAADSFTGLLAGRYTITIRDANGCRYTRTVNVENITGPTGLTLASTTSTCGSSNGSITVNGATGGTAPYTFSLDGSTFQSATTFASVMAGEHTITVKDANGCTFSKKVTVENIAGPTDLLATTRSSVCGASNGALTLSGVTGGTAPYTYSKDGITFQTAAIFDGLLAGQHTITVKDANGCSFSKAFTVSDVTGPTAVAATTSPASCENNDGNLTISGVTGGTAPYTYSINGTSFQTGNTFTGLATGTYTVTAKDTNGCEVTASVKVNQNVPTSFTSSTIASTCGRSDGAITVGTVEGGTAPYTYSKDGVTFQASATFTDLAAGNHSITVRDAKGCTFSARVAVSNVSGPTFTTAAVASTCGSTNGSISVNAVTGGVAPYTYSKDGVTFQASTTFPNLLAGTYTISVKDANGCLSSETVEVEDKAGPSAFALTSVSSTCGNSNGRITARDIIGGTAPYSFSKDGSTFQASSTFENLAAGAYTITVKDANGCVLAKTVRVDNIAGPSDVAMTTVSSTCGASNGQITLTGVTNGTAPYAFSLDGGAFQTTTTFGSVLAGEHTVVVRDVNGCVYSKKVTVRDIAGPTNLLASTKASTCGASNGELTVTGVTGGTEPYTYSKDGLNFQASASFTTLKAGSYTFTVKDANGCTFTKAYTVSDLAGPSAVTASATTASCNDNDGSITVTGVTGGTAPYTYALNGNGYQAGNTFTALASGTYTVIARDANGCEVTTSVRVETVVPTNFTHSFTSSTCGSSNGGITVGNVTGGYAPYTYSIDGTTFQSAASFTGLAAGSYTITVKDAKGCTIVEQVQVTDIAGASGFTASVDATTCGDNNGKITISDVIGGTAPFTYSVDGTNFQAATTFASLAPGTFTITVKDANGCTFTKEAVVSGSTSPTSFQATLQSSTCGDANGTITVSDITGGVAPYTYSIDGSTFQASATLAGLRAGQYTITVKDVNGCTFAKTVEVENIPGPGNFTLATLSTTCGESNGTITLSNITGGTAPYSFSLDGTNFTTPSTVLSSFAFENVKAGAYQITVRDANGCILVKGVSVADQPGVTAIATATKPATCESNGAITITGTTGGTAPYTYSLDGITYQASNVFSALAPQEYKVYVKDANACTASFTVQIGENRLKGAEVTATATDCGLNNGSISVSGVNGGVAPYAYSINGTTFQASTQFTNLAPGTYTVTVRDAEGCTITKTQEVENSGGLESFVLTNTDASCGNKNGQITIGQVTGGQGPYTYSIRTMFQTPSESGTMFQTEAEFTNLAEGTYQVSVKDAKGCVLEKTATIGSSPAITNLAFSVKPAGCGQTAGQVTVDGVTGGTAPYTYSLDGAAFVSSTSFSGIAAGNHTLSVKDARNCTYQVTVTVKQLESSVTLVRDVLCATDRNGSITISTKGGDSQTEFSINNGATFQKDSVFSNLAAGTYQVITRFSATCTITIGRVEVKAPAPVQVTVTPLTETSAAVTAISGGTAPYTYKLDNGQFTSATEFTDLSEGTHTLVVKDQNGCTTEVSFNMASTAGFEIPNGFTPNGDGINDLWVLKNLTTLFPRCKVTVYNRWGSPVFESHGYKKPWDGTHQGKPLPVGTYYTVIELGNGKAPLRKSLTIMR
ncbi:T9SS type B sorting domain-containing protein [Rufibacter tibetensis]|uniref:PKD/Chitinase domain-containing protein n=1 Tax=Rufibacter tibetensis TaxID=512763 RepID=A0A0P0C575_9BACT|nr:gliding motility-associated C-terminal domain-containing protein [Rufibacter tibetensis]ALI98382.1 hypothetical protein DC20_04565 [Rufibacter tibetensis]